MLRHWHQIMVLRQVIVNVCPSYHQYLLSSVLLRASSLHTSAVAMKRPERKNTSNKRAKFQWLTDQKIEKARLKREEDKERITIKVYNKMTVGELADALSATADDIFEVMLIIKNKNINKYDRATSVIDDLSVITEVVKKVGMRPIVIPAPKSVEHAVERQTVDIERRVIDPSSDSVKRRPPVVTVMGHVDHGKTTLLDSLRHTNVVSTEFGGITQHIGAFSVRVGQQPVTFLDTPGHSAFSSMRSRGAHVTDVVVLVVACDDGVMEQTVESVRMARSAAVPVIVAVNKCDLAWRGDQQRVDRCKHQLLDLGLHLEEFGGDVPCVHISAINGSGIDALSETILALAEVLDLRAEYSGRVEGVVVESRVDTAGRGKLATVLVQHGTLTNRQYLVAGTAWAKVRSLHDDSGNQVPSATPSTPVVVSGWREELPQAGDIVLQAQSQHAAQHLVATRRRQQSVTQQVRQAAVVSDRQSGELYERYLRQRHWSKRQKRRAQGLAASSHQALDTDTAPSGEDTAATGIPKLPVIIKGDVDGSIEALLDVLVTYDCDDKCKLDLIHHSVGPVLQSDVDMAALFNGVIFTFNAPCPQPVRELSISKGVSIREHNVIYKFIDDLISNINERLPLLDVEHVLGEAQVLQQFLVTEAGRSRSKVAVAGCLVTDGSITKSGMYKLYRDEHLIYQGTCSSLKHIKDDVDSVSSGTECGVVLDIDKGSGGGGEVQFEPGDTLVCYEIVQKEQSVSWRPPGF